MMFHSAVFLASLAFALRVAIAAIWPAKVGAPPGALIGVIMLALASFVLLVASIATLLWRTLP